MQSSIRKAKAKKPISLAIQIIFMLFFFLHENQSTIIIDFTFEIIMIRYCCGLWILELLIHFISVN